VMLSDKTLTCVECGYEFTFTAGEQEFFAPRVTPTSRGGVLNAAVLGRAKSEVPETPTDQPERCIRQFVLSAVGTRWFPSCLEVTSPSTVAIASAQ
jgi:hypothetical protein